MGLLKINNTILAELASGKSRQNIYSELSQLSPAESGKFAYCINSIPTEELRKKYLLINALLIISLAGYSLLTLISEFPIDFTKPTLFIFLKVFVPVVFSYFVFHFHGGLYRLIGLWCVIDLLETFALPETGLLLSNLVRLVVLFICIVLSWLIARMVFPNLTFLGPRKDKAGNYLI